MNNSSNNPGPETLSFSSFLSNDGLGEVSRSKTKVLRVPLESLRRMLPARRATPGEIVASPILKRRVVSRDLRDVYGQPRILTGWEAVLHVLAWPAVIGVVIGFGLAIALLVIHNFAPLPAQEKNNRPMVAEQD